MQTSDYSNTSIHADRTSDRPVLSISMLVSDHRGETVEKCLQSLQPLRRAVATEVILVDTGTEGDSIRVAAPYADRVVKFSWCNDFAAARNAGLSLCRGEWFLFLDDDEWFDDVTEFIPFFRDGLYKKYEAAWYIVRNYTNLEGTAFTDGYVGRMCRLTENSRFVGKVHEYMEPLPTKIYYFSVFAHHYGYVFKNEEERQRHFLRNLSLEEAAVKENPTDIRMCSQLAREYASVGRFEEGLAQIRAILSKTQYGMENSFVQNLRIMEAVYLSKSGDPEGGLVLLRELKKSPKLFGMAKLGVWYEEAAICGKNGQEEEMLAALSEYVAWYPKRNEPDGGYPVLDFCFYRSEDCLHEVAEMGICSLLRLHTKESAVRYADLFFSIVPFGSLGKKKTKYLSAILQLFARKKDPAAGKEYIRRCLAESMTGTEIAQCTEEALATLPEGFCTLTKLAEALPTADGITGVLQLCARIMDNRADAGEVRAMFIEEKERGRCLLLAAAITDAEVLSQLLLLTDGDGYREAASLRAKAAERTEQLPDLLKRTEPFYSAQLHALYLYARMISFREKMPKNLTIYGKNADNINNEDLIMFSECGRQYAAEIYEESMCSEIGRSCLPSVVREALDVWDRFQIQGADR